MKTKLRRPSFSKLLRLSIGAVAALAFGAGAGAGALVIAAVFIVWGLS